MQNNQHIQRWKNGDHDSAEKLYDKWRSDVMRLAFGLLNNGYNDAHADAEEVMQDALLYALANIDQYDPKRASFRTWLHRITVSRCRDRLRRKRFPILAWRDWFHNRPDPVASQPKPEQLVAQSWEETILWQQIEQLSEKQREVVILRFWAGHSLREIGEIVGISTPSVQSRLSNAYAKLRPELEADALPVLAAEVER